LTYRVDKQTNTRQSLLAAADISKRLNINSKVKCREKDG